MGSVGGLLGTAGGAGGTGFSGPQAADVINPVTSGDIDNARAGVQNSMQAQSSLLQALQAQNGIGNQSQVYNQLQGVANGTGPNPAQAMLNQATGQNVANQAALMAGQRGAGSNVGLMARQAAQQGAGVQQQAVGQGATMQANQSLNAINAAGQMANNQAANQIGQTNANTQAQQANQGQIYGAVQGVNNSNVGMQSNINSANAALADETMKGQQAMIGGALNGGAAGMKAAMGAGGGMVQFADGGQAFASGPQSKFGQFLAGAGQSLAPTPDQNAMPSTPDGQLKKGSDNFTQGLISALSAKSKPPGQSVAGGGDNLPGGADSPAVMVGAEGGQAHDLRGGGNVKAKNPSQKAVVSGNSYANDKIPAVLSEGEVVLPRSVMECQDPVSASAKFVQAVLQKRKMRGA